jgi:hypothetical protein
MANAQGWIEDHVPRSDRIITDDAIWVDLVEAGFEPDDVVWYYKVDTDPAVQDQAPDGWRDYDWLLSTESFRSFPETVGTEAAAALEHSVVVATFGEGAGRVEVRRIVEEDVAVVEAAVGDDALEAEAGQALARNPAIDLSGPAARLLEAGQVDQRVLTVLAGVAGEQSLSVVDFPAVPGEGDAGMPRRVVELERPEGADGGWLDRFFAGQQPPFAPDSVTTVDAAGGGPTHLRVTFPVALPRLSPPA